jgi:hypothetical protein
MRHVRLRVDTEGRSLTLGGAEFLTAEITDLH